MVFYYFIKKVLIFRIYNAVTETLRNPLQDFFFIIAVTQHIVTINFVRCSAGYAFEEALTVLTIEICRYLQEWTTNNTVISRSNLNFFIIITFYEIIVIFETVNDLINLFNKFISCPRNNSFFFTRSRIIISVLTSGSFIPRTLAISIAIIFDFFIFYLTRIAEFKKITILFE